MASRLTQWLALLPALLLPALGLLPDAALGERGPRVVARGPAAEIEDANNARVIVKYRAGSALARSAAGAPRHAATLGRYAALTLTDGHVLGSRLQSVRGTGLTSSQLATKLASHPDVEWAEPVRRKTINAVLPNDPYYADGQTSITPAVGQWYLRAPDSTIVSAINAVGAWAVTTGSANITVAVLDTGVVKSHPDLAGKLWAGYDFISRTSNSVDGNGLDADASDPGDWTAADECKKGTLATASSWHGTEVAGLIGAASDNGIGMASVGRNVMVLPVRVLGKCGGYDDDIIAGMRWAAGLSNSAACAANLSTHAVGPDCNPNLARVINMSLGSPVGCGAYQSFVDEITAAGVVVVVAAGNDAGLAVSSPANCTGVIAVAGVRHAGSKVGYSSIGPEVTIAAPAGNCVNETGACLYPLLTTTNNGSTTPGANIYSDSYRSSLGTSFAAPLVAGTVALMLSVDPALTPAGIKTALQASARAFPSIGSDAAVAACKAPSSAEQLECHCTTSTCGAGLLDAGAAVARVAGLTTPPLAITSVSSLTPTVGATVNLEGLSSSRSAVAYQWQLTAGASIARFLTSTSTGSTSLTTTGPGIVTVSLLVTDSAGASASATQTITAVLTPTAAFSASTTVPTVGGSVALDGSGSIAATGRTLTGYKWAITSGGTLAKLNSATANTVATTLTTSAAGTVVLTLTVTDSAGSTASASRTITVAAAPVVVTPTPTSTTSSGGGALGWGWLLGLAAAVAGVGWRRRD